jgi:hypothetical protein
MMTGFAGGFAQGFTSTYDMFNKAKEKREKTIREEEAALKKQNNALEIQVAQTNAEIQAEADKLEAERLELLKKGDTDGANLKSQSIDNLYNSGKEMLGVLSSQTGKQFALNVQGKDTSKFGKARMMNTTGEEVEVILPESITAKISENPSLYVYGENGNVFERTVENAVATNNLVDTQIRGYVPQASKDDTLTVYVDGKPQILPYAEGVKLVNDKKATLENPQDNTGEYFSVDGKVGVYSKSQLKEATRQGARVRRIEKPTSSSGSTKRDSLAQKQTVEERVRRAKYNYESNPNEATKEEYYYAKKMYDSTITGVASAQEVDQKSSVKKALTYKDGLSKDTYNPDEAMDVEIDFKFTDAYDKNSKLKAEEDEFNNAVVSYNQTKDLSNIFSQAVKNGTYKSGAVDTSIKTITSYTPEEFSQFIGQDREAIKEQLGLDGQIGDAVAQYLKLMSGTAASQKEAASTLNNFVGGAFLNEDVREKKLKSFVEKKKRDLDVRAKQLTKRGLVHTSGEWMYGKKADNTVSSAKQEPIQGKAIRRTINGVTKTWDGTKWVN